MTEQETNSPDDLDHLFSSLVSEDIELQPIPAVESVRPRHVPRTPSPDPSEERHPALGSARPRHVPPMYENGSHTPSPYSSEELDPAAREDSSEDEEWNLVPVPVNEEARPRHFSGVTDPYGVELIPLTEPPEVTIRDPRHSPRGVNARQRGSPREEEPLKGFSPRDVDQCARPRTPPHLVSSPPPKDPRYSPASNSPRQRDSSVEEEALQRFFPKEEEMVVSHRVRPRTPQRTNVYDSVRPRTPSQMFVAELERVRSRTPPQEEPIVTTATEEHVLEQEPPGIDAAQKESQLIEVENKLDDAMREGDFDSIEEEVTAKTLTSCKTNALLKAFQVNKRLKDLADGGSPEKDEFQTLANSVDEFTSALINPLKADDDTRNTFGRCLDYVVDKAIDAEQKKFISHPVVYNLLLWRWYGSFLSLEKSPWSKPGRWRFLLLNLWTLIDMIVFPILFAVFSIIHMIHERSRKRGGSEIGFVVSLSTDATDEVFTLIKNTISYVIHKYGCQGAKHCVIQREDENLANCINFDFGFDDEASLLKKVATMKKAELTHPQLHKDLCQARDSFKSSSLRPGAKKILLVFVNDQIDTIGNGNKELKAVIEEMKQLGVKLVPVGIGEHARLRELTEIASQEIAPLHFGDYELPRTLGKTILQGVEGKDMYERYLDYFTTPYFIFVRDTLSNLVLLGLHFAICLSPSTVAFSGLEWAIFVFFLGRIVMEVDQFVHAKMAERKATKHKTFRGSNYEICSPSEQNGTQPEGNVVLRKFSKYFTDRWNQIDFIMLVIYVITFTLRMVTWGTSTAVYDNRPLAVACYLYGLIAMFLTLRVFGHVMECVRGMGAIQIALFFIMRDVAAIFWQFLATILAFSLVMTKVYIAEGSYTSNRNATEELACSNGSFDCWWSIAKHLAWSLLGLADLDSLNSIDGPSVTLIHFLYSLFLIMGVILLVNMMIALLSNTYQRVEDNSLREWSFKKAITVKTYSVYHPTPVPFNLISIPVVALYQLCQRCFCKGRPINKAGLDKRGRRTALDRLVVKLQRMYFANYGYSFPLTDERKMDQLLHETDGNRQMANQIVHRVFRQRGCRQEKSLRTGAYSSCIICCMDADIWSNLARKGIFCGRGFANSSILIVTFCKHGPTDDDLKRKEIKKPTFNDYLYEAWASLGIEIEGCLLTYQGPDFCDVCKGSGNQNQNHGARHLAPFTREMPRIEVLIQESGERRMLAVGVVYDTYDFHLMPGWRRKTVGYHVDDGRIFEEGCDELGREVKDAMAYRGDLVACQVDFDGVVNGRIPVVFFLNGRKVANATMRYTAGRTSLFPFISMGYEGVRVLAKMCPPVGNPAQSSSPTERDLEAMQNMWHVTQEVRDAFRYQIEEIEDRRRKDTMMLKEKITEQQKMIAELKSLLVDLSRDLKKDSSD